MFFQQTGNKSGEQQAQKLMKLNKGEKRALKFAIKDGIDLGNVEDIKAFLNERMEHYKQTQHRRSKEGYIGEDDFSGQKVVRARKTDNYADLEEVKDQAA